MCKITLGPASRNPETFQEGRSFHTDEFGLGRIYSVPDPDPEKEFRGAVQVEFIDLGQTIADRRFGLMFHHKLTDPGFALFAISEAIDTIHSQDIL